MTLAEFLKEHEIMFERTIVDPFSHEDLLYVRVSKQLIDKLCRSGWSDCVQVRFKADDDGVFAEMICRKPLTNLEDHERP